eukprot:317616-Prorocentrum_minimum.AAC.2
MLRRARHGHESPDPSGPLRLQPPGYRPRTPHLDDFVRVWTGVQWGCNELYRSLGGCPCRCAVREGCTLPTSTPVDGDGEMQILPVDLALPARLQELELGIPRLPLRSGHPPAKIQRYNGQNVALRRKGLKWPRRKIVREQLGGELNSPVAERLKSKSSAKNWGEN